MLQDEPSGELRDRLNARRTLRGIDKQVAKTERAVDGHGQVKRHRYIQLSVRRSRSTGTWRARPARWPTGSGYTTNLTTVSPEFVIDAYHQLWHIDKSFRMSTHDLQARPVVGVGEPDAPHTFREARPVKVRRELPEPR
jgi:hypothetical protein